MKPYSFTKTEQIIYQKERPKLLWKKTRDLIPEKLRELALSGVYYDSRVL